MASLRAYPRAQARTAGLLSRLGGPPLRQARRSGPLEPPLAPREPPLRSPGGSSLDQGLTCRNSVDLAQLRPDRIVPTDDETLLLNEVCFHAGSRLTVGVRRATRRDDVLSAASVPVIWEQLIGIVGTG